MARIIAGPAADWLASRRAELNQRFERMRRRFPSLSPDAVLAVLGDVLPPLAGPEPRAGDLLSAVYDLVLLQAGRDTLSKRPAVNILLRATFPKIRALLLQRPSILPGALSNAVENMGPRGLPFAEAIGALAEVVEQSDVLLDGMAVVAWRLGEARLRASALAAASQLPARVVLRALDLDDFPLDAAALVVAALSANGWRHPRHVFSDRALESLRSPTASELASLLQQVTHFVPPRGSAWRVANHAGDFSGFDGHFDAPPLVLDGGSPHQWFARSASQDFRVDADIFGWICRPHPPVDLPVRQVLAPSGFEKLVGKLSGSANQDRLTPDGTLMVAGQSVRLVDLAGATSYLMLPGVVAATSADSHRIRIALPQGIPL